MITPKKLHKAAGKLRDVEELLSELKSNGDRDWPFLIGFDLGFLADMLEKHADRIDWATHIDGPHREPPPAGYRAGGPNG